MLILVLQFSHLTSWLLKWMQPTIWFARAHCRSFIPYLYIIINRSFVLMRTADEWLRNIEINNGIDV